MTDPITASATVAGAIKPIAEIVFKIRPKAWIEMGNKAESKVTELMFERSGFIPPEDFESIQEKRKA